MVAVLAAISPTLSKAQTQVGTEVLNVVRVDYTNVFGVEKDPVTASALFTVDPVRTPSTIIFYNYAPTVSGAESINIDTINYQDGPNGPLTPLAPPNDFGNPIDLNVPVPLLPTGLYHAGQPIFLTLEDIDQNLQPDIRETVLVTLTVSATGDEEVLRFVETGPNTGLFAGYIPSASGSTTIFDGVLTLEPEAEIVASYIDVIDGTDVSSAAALIDPFGIVFDSQTGLPVNGAIVTIINNATGLPATVIGDDGFSLYPSVVVTGSTVQDSSGTSYPMPDGGFRFPLLAAGDYRLEVEPPAGYTFASTVDDVDLQSLPGAPFELVVGSRGEVFTLLPGPALEIDVPIDPAPDLDPGVGLFLQKSAFDASVAIGDFLRYDLVLENTGIDDATNIVLEDTLPHGFRYQSGSAYLGNVKLPDPDIAENGRDLTFNGLGFVPAGESVELRYVVEVTSATRLGDATNRAIFFGSGNAESNEARATVTVVDDLRGDNILIGRVMIRPMDRDLWTKDDQTIGLPGLEGARLYLEDGSYVITDDEGRFHFEGVSPGVHVVQLDGLSVPEKYEIIGVENTRFAGRDYSQFVDLQAGVMWRTDFFVVERAPRQGVLSAEVCELVEDGFAGAVVSLKSDLLEVSRLRAIFMLPEGVEVVGKEARFGERSIAMDIRGKTVTVDLGAFAAGESGKLRVPFSHDAPADINVLLFADANGEKNIRSDKLTFRLDGAADCSAEVRIEREVEWGEVEPVNTPIKISEDSRLSHDADWLDKVGSSFEWVEPALDYVPTIPVLSMGIKYPTGHRIELYNDGELVSGLFLEGSITGTKRETTLRRWTGLNIELGSNPFTAVIIDSDGNEVERIERNFHYSGPAVRAEYVKESSILVADGRTNPAIALRLTDAEGKPVRPGMRGSFRVDPPYEALSFEEQRIDRFLRVGERERQVEYEVGENGVALLYLEPTAQSGEVTVRLDLNQREFDFQAWLEAAPRDWILVGLATGTVGYNDISSRIDDFEDGEIEENYYEDGRVAFFAKGRVKGKWLLTAAYDSDKKSEQRGQESLHQIIDPDTYYTLYGDETDQGYEASSAEKLYVKLEREKFYAMFGDFDTGLTVTELSRYSRSLTGFKTEYHGDNFTFNGFVSETDFTYVRDEIQGDGTSGLYRLSRNSIVINSEKIRIQTRDRFQSEVIIEERELSRHLDYNINYDDSTIYFKSPIFSRDENLNPIFIIAEYEVEGDGESYNYGGRASVKTEDDRVELGVTYVHEEDSETEGDLVGADLHVKINEQHEFRAEIARTEVDAVSSDAFDAEGNAYLVELTHRSVVAEGSIYYRQQDSEFGLGQQNVSETGTRKYGFRGSYLIDREINAVAEVYHEELLGTGDTRNHFGAYLERRFDDTAYRLGYIWTEDDIDGDDSYASSQLHAGVSRNLFSDKFIFRLDHYQSLGDDGESSDYPTRSILGVDYFLNEKVRFFTEYQLAFGEETDSENARAGMALLPWTGANIDTSVQQEISEDGGRTYANFGLGQILQLNDNWSIDGGFDSGRTFNESSSGVSGEPLNFNPNTPSASGSSEDFTALSLGATYREKTWSWSGRAEQRYAEIDDRWSLYTGIIGEISDGLHMALQGSLFETQAENGNDSTNADVRYSIAYRPLDSEWIWLNKLELLYDSIGGNNAFENFRIVNRGDVNYLPHEDLQIAFQYGHKYVFTTIEGDEFDGFSDFYGIEARYDIHERVDLGIRGSVRHSWNSHVFDFSFGPSIGVNPVDNMWISLGYNVTGFTDEDFSRSDYTAQGPYIQFRVKFDQETFKDVASLLKHDM
ncbi:MAG: hypothetical protein AAF065_10705 [Verrucomicrobiota bacterium]